MEYEEIAKIEDLLEILKTASTWVRRHPHEDEMLRKNNSYRCWIEEKYSHKNGEILLRSWTLSS